MKILPFPLKLSCRERRRVREIRKETHAQNDRLFDCDQGGRGEKSENKGSHGGDNGQRRTAQLFMTTLVKL